MIDGLIVFKYYKTVNVQYQHNEDNKTAPKHDFSVDRFLFLV